MKFSNENRINKCRFSYLKRADVRFVVFLPFPFAMGSATTFN